MLYPLSICGLVLSPFAAIRMFRMAGDRELDPTRYAILGAVYSILFVFPWLYLSATVRGRSFPISGVLFVLYVAWLIGPISTSLALGATGEGWQWVAAGTIMVLACVGSMILMAFSALSDPYERKKSLRHGSPPFKHIIPFACTYASVWLMRLEF